MFGKYECVGTGYNNKHQQIKWLKLSTWPWQKGLRCFFNGMLLDFQVPALYTCSNLLPYPRQSLLNIFVKH